MLKISLWILLDPKKPVSPSLNLGSYMADQTNIEIKPSPPLPPQPLLSAQLGLAEDPFLDYQKIPFFKSDGARSKRDTWVISLFVIFHLLAFIATMFVNDCWRNSQADCILKPLGRMSFQPLSENPLLGPSASSLDEMGALRKKLLTNQHQTWRLFTNLWLHAGFFHLFINLSSTIFIGMRLEQEFGPLRIGIVYLLAALFGSMVATFFLGNGPAVSSSSALFGLLGAMLSGLLLGWEFYTNKVAALMALLFISITNLVLGLLPYVNNFSNIGGFVSGIVLGFVLLFRPPPRKILEKKRIILDCNVNWFTKLKLNMDRLVLRSICLVLFGLMFFGGLMAFVHNVNVNQYCSWCKFIDCIPSKRWSCNERAVPCQAMMSTGWLTLTCSADGNFREFPYTNITQARMDDLCSLICS